MKNKNILYGLLGVGAIAGLYFWNKNKKPKTYPSECEMRYSVLLKPAVMMPPEYWEKQKEDWMKTNCK
jgi:hypothetical protein